MHNSVAKWLLRTLLYGVEFHIIFVLGVSKLIINKHCKVSAVISNCVI